MSNFFQTSTEVAEFAQRFADRVHAEDLSIGDDVAVFAVTLEFVSFLWCPADLSLLPPSEPVRIALRPYTEHEPLKVRAICLPFLLCERPEGKHIVHDVRRVELVRLSASFAKRVRSALRRDKKMKDEKRGPGKKSRKKKTRKSL